MEAGKAGSILIILGILSGAVGLFSGDLFLSNLLYIGISWFVAGFVYLLAGREISDGGFLAALLLGVVGAVLWLVIDISRGKSGPEPWKYSDKKSYYKRIVGENYKCHSCMWFGKPGCKRKEELLNAEPCEDFVYWGESK